VESAKIGREQSINIFQIKAAPFYILAGTIFD
jgi:hypothetical protein